MRIYLPKMSTLDMGCFERQGLRMFEKLVDVVEELVKLQTTAQTD